MDDRRSMRRWRALALISLGLVIGITMSATPATSHVGGTVGHLWKKHIRPKADNRYVQKCNQGAIAAVARFFDNGSIPSDGSFVEANRFGGETNWSCHGGKILLQRFGATGGYRFKLEPALPSNGYYLAVAAPDTHGSTTLAAHVSGPFAGGIYDVHVKNLSGAPTNPYYFTIMLVRGN